MINFKKSKCAHVKERHKERNIAVIAIWCICEQHTGISIYMSVVSNLSVDERKIGTTLRSVVQENRLALLRRWDVAQNDSLSSIQLGQCYPGQRYLMDILKVASKGEVIRMSECPFALFKINDMLEKSIELAPNEPQNTRFEVDPFRANEVFKALIARLDAVKTDRVEMSQNYGVSAEEITWLQTFSPYDIERISWITGLTLVLNVSDRYFVAALGKAYSRQELGILAVTMKT